LIAKCLVFLDDDCDLAIFVESTDPFFIDQLDNRSLNLLELIWVSRIVIDALLAIAESKPRPLVSLDLWVGIGGHQIKVSLLLWVVDELRNIYLQLLLNTKGHTLREPVLGIPVELWVLNCKLDIHKHLSLFATSGVNSWGIEVAHEDSIIVVVLVVSDFLIVEHDEGTSSYRCGKCIHLRLPADLCC
jgi:hypothetical protein